MVTALHRSRITVAVAVAVAFAGLPLAALAQSAPGTPVGPAFDVRPESASSQVGPAVARSAAGTVIVWRDAASNAIVGRRLAGNGAPLDDGFVIASAVPKVDVVAAPDVAIDAAGNVVVFWLLSDARDFDVPNRRPSRVQGRRYTADGVPAGALLTPDAADPTATHSVPAVAIDADGDFAVSFKRGFARIASNRLTVTREDSVAQRYGRDGTAQGALITADSRVATAFDGTVGGFFFNGGIDLQTFTGSEVDVAMDDDGDLALAWVEQAASESSLRQYPLFTRVQTQASDVIKVRRYTAAGAARGPVQRVTTARYFGPASGPSSGSSIFRAPSIAMAANSDHVVAWSESSRSSFATTINARLYAADGSARSAERAYASFDDALLADRAAVAMAADGTFVLTWNEGAGIAARVVAAGGEPLSDRVLVSPRASSEVLSSPDVAIGRSGTIAVAWTRGTGFANAGQTVRARLLAGP